MNEDGIVVALERLALAVEKQNVIQLDWVELQKRWHNENEEANAQQAEAVKQAAYQAYLEVYKSQEHQP